jgi:glutathione S-transferase
MHSQQPVSRSRHLCLKTCDRSGKRSLQVWLLLEEKQIPYTMEKINMRSYGDKPQSFLKKARLAALL